MKPDNREPDNREPTNREPDNPLRRNDSAPNLSAEEVTRLLRRWSGGDREAASELMPLVYDELRRIAADQFRRERADHTLQATAIVHEAYLRLSEQNGLRWQNRSHFFGLAAHVVRRILVDHSRERGCAKRGGGKRRVTLAEAASIATARPPDLQDLDDALRSLAEIDPQKASIVELRFFGGLTIEETAEFLAVSPATIVRQWRRAKAWLYCELNEK